MTSVAIPSTHSYQSAGATVLSLEGPDGSMVRMPASDKRLTITFVHPDGHSDTVPLFEIVARYNPITPAEYSKKRPLPAEFGQTVNQFASPSTPIASNSSSVCYGDYETDGTLFTTPESPRMAPPDRVFAEFQYNEDRLVCRRILEPFIHFERALMTVVRYGLRGWDSWQLHEIILAHRRQVQETLDCLEEDPANRRCTMDEMVKTMETHYRTLFVPGLEQLTGCLFNLLVSGTRIHESSGDWGKKQEARLALVEKSMKSLESYYEMSLEDLLGENKDIVLRFQQAVLCGRKSGIGRWADRTVFDGDSVPMECD